MGFQSGVNQAIGTVGAMASIKKVVEGQQEGIAKQEESNKIAKENTEQLEAQNTLLAMDEADKINEEYAKNTEAIKGSEKELETLGEDVKKNTDKLLNTKSNRWKDKYQKSIDEMNNKIESLANTRVQLDKRQKALQDRANIIDKTTGGKLKDYLFLGTDKEWEERYRGNSNSKE